MLRMIVLLLALVGGSLWLWADDGDDGPAPLRTVVEDDRSRASTAAVFGGPTRSLTYRAILPSPVEPEAIDKAAARILRTAPSNSIVGIRFVFSDYPRDIVEDIGQPYYAWRLFWPGRDTIAVFSGISEQQALEQFRKLVLQPGETIESVWIDHYSTLGLVAITTIKSERHFLHVAMPEARWRMRLRTGPGPGTHLVAIEQVMVSGDQAGAKYKADGIGTDTLAVAIRPGGSLDVFGGRYRPDAKPWLIAKAFKP